MASTKKRLQIVAALLAVALLLGVAVRMLDRDSGGQGGDYSGSYNEAYKNAELISCTFSQTGVWPDKLDDNSFMLFFSSNNGEIQWFNEDYVEYVKALIEQDVNSLVFAVREGSFDILPAAGSGAQAYGSIRDTCVDGSPLFAHKVTCGEMEPMFDGFALDNTTVPPDRYDYVAVSLDESMLDMEWTFSIVLDFVALYCMYDKAEDGTVTFNKSYTMDEYKELKSQLKSLMESRLKGELGDYKVLEEFEAFRASELQLNETVYRVELDLYAMRGNEFLFPAD